MADGVSAGLVTDAEAGEHALDVVAAAGDGTDRCARDAVAAAVCGRGAASAGVDSSPARVTQTAAAPVMRQAVPLGTRPGSAKR
ncbi:hypothetical protein ABZV75_23605 [Streptomyces flaveolus]|uniref:hypothetical protein n=1 Tax=Streptomyces flaveolus TaxID=67297 RepID=UPI00339E9F80